MKLTAILTAAVLYTGLTSGANADLDALRTGEMAKLTVHATPEAVPTVTVTDPDGAAHSLADYRGKHVLVNFWATWCAPCRHEMPQLDALQRDLGGDSFAVVPIATGRNALAGINRFFDQAGIEHLPILLDPKQALAREMGVLGLPMTMLIDADGNEIARMSGEADWSSPEALALIKAAMAAGS